MNEHQKDSLYAGFVIIVIILLFLFSFAPVAHYLSKWWTYWNSKNTYSVTVTPTQSGKNEGAANVDCASQAEEYFNTRVVSSWASSTSDDFTSYDCYATKYTKIPLIPLILSTTTTRI